MTRTRVPGAAARMPARYFALLCELLVELGVDLPAVLRAAKLSPAQIDGTDASLDVAQGEALIAEALRVSGRSDLGFLVGRRIKLSNHEILGYGIITSPTLDYALTLAARYYRLMTPWFTMIYRRGPQHCELQFQPAVRLQPQALNFLLEMVMVSAHEQLKSQLHGALLPYDIFVSYPAPAHAASYRELRPARLHFEVERLPGARMVLETEMLSQPLPMADRTALKMAEGRCDELLSRTARETGMTGWVTMMLRESHQGLPSLAELAHLLNQSPRTLDRQLGREGSRFRELSKRIRHERACELLQAGLGATQVAYQVGYRDAANFTRAFRREGGMSPSEFVAAISRDAPDRASRRKSGRPVAR